MNLKEKLENTLKAYTNVPPCPNCGSYNIVNVYNNNGKLTSFDECEDCGKQWRVK